MFGNNIKNNNTLRKEKRKAEEKPNNGNTFLKKQKL